MFELQRKIKLKEHAIQRSTDTINKQEKVLTPYFRSKWFCTLEIVGSFTAGFLISKNKSMRDVIAFLVSQSFTVAKIHNYFKLVSKHKM